jgi:hypothetical protein
MRHFKSTTAFVLSLFSLVLNANAQFTDSATSILPERNAAMQSLSWQLPPHKKSFKVKPFIIPALMVAYGVTAIENDRLQGLNGEFKEEIYVEHPHKQIPIDNYLQFAPAAMVYGLDVFGIKAKHNFRDRTFLFLLSNIFTNVSVHSVKSISRQLRPDGSKYNSFPSGHTAEAFANAEFLWQEYKDVSPWYGVAGYAMAATTGYLRMYNNKHWLSDVAAGAGIGIISTKLAYWLYPKIQYKLFKDKPVNTMIMPSWQNGNIGLGMIRRF